MEGGCIICGSIRIQWCLLCCLPLCAKHSQLHIKRNIRAHIIQRNTATVPLVPTQGESVSQLLGKILKCLDILRGSHIRCNFEQRVTNILEDPCHFFLDNDYKSIRLMSISNNLTFIATLSDNDIIRVWNLRIKKQISCVRGKSSWIQCMAITNDGNNIVLGSDCGSVVIWNTGAVPSERLLGHTLWVSFIVLTRDDKYIISASKDNTIRIWSLQHKTLEGILVDQHVKGICLILTKDDKYIISGSNAIRIWDFQTRIQEATLEISTLSVVKSLAITSDNKYIVCGCDDCAIIIFNFSERRLEAILQGHNGPVLTVGLSSNDKYIVSYSEDRTIMLWSLEKQCQESVLKKFSLRYDKCVVIADDNRYIISGKPHNVMEIHNFMEKKQKITFEGHAKPITTLAITSDYRYIVTGSRDKRVIIWDFHQRIQIAVLKNHKNPVTCVGITSDDKYIISGSCEKIIVWAFEKVKRRQKIQAIIVVDNLNMTSVALTKNRRYIVASTCSEIEEIHNYVWKAPLVK